MAQKPSFCYFSESTMEKDYLSPYIEMTGSDKQIIEDGQELGLEFNPLALFTIQVAAYKKEGSGYIPLKVGDDPCEEGSSGSGEGSEEPVDPTEAPTESSEGSSEEKVHNLLKFMKIMKL